MTTKKRVFLRRIRQKRIGLKCYIFLCLLKEKFLPFYRRPISVPQELKRDFIFKAYDLRMHPFFKIEEIMRNKVKKLSNNIYEDMIKELFPYSETMTDEERLMWLTMADLEPVVEINKLLC